MAEIEHTTARRFADSLLRTLARDTILIRIPANAEATDQQQIGLTSVALTDIPLHPVLIQKTAAKANTITVSAETLERSLQTYESDALKRALLESAGLMVHGFWMDIRSVDTLYLHSRAYLYQITTTLRQTDEDA